MITLIIFLCFLATFSVFVLKKIKINIELNINNFEYIFKLNIFSKEKITKGNVFDFIKSGGGKVDFDFVKDISSVINVNQLNTNVEIGTEFVFLTNGIFVFLSTAIPMLYNFSANSKKNLSFDIKPYYDKFCLLIDVKTEVELTLFDLFIIYLKFRKNKYINSKSVQINRRY